jgi:hypothetical protein
MYNLFNKSAAYSSACFKSQQIIAEMQSKLTTVLSSSKNLSADFAAIEETSNKIKPHLKVIALYEKTHPVIKPVANKLNLILEKTHALDNSLKEISAFEKRR